MKSFTAYQTTDGSIFKSHDEGKQHQDNLDMRNDLDELVNSKDTYSGFDSEFIDFVMEHKKEILNILNK